MQIVVQESVELIEESAVATAKRIEFFWMNQSTVAKSMTPKLTQTIDSYIFVTGGRPAIYERRTMPKIWRPMPIAVTGRAASVNFFARPTAVDWIWVTPAAESQIEIAQSKAATR